MTHVLAWVGIWALTAQAAPGEPAAVPGCRPPSAQLVARRAAALAFLSSRAWLEMKVLEATSSKDLKVLHQRQEELESRSSTLRVDEVMTPKERALLHKDLGGWRRQEIATGSWAMEGAGTLLWTLGMQADMPSYDAPMTMVQALKPLMMQGNAEELVASGPKLRGSQELLRARTEAALWEWRVEQEMGRRRTGSGEVPPQVRERLARAFADGVSSKHNGKDLLVGRSPITEVGPKKLGLMLSTARARTDALRWVCNDR